MSVSAYIKWLVANGHSGQHAGNEMVLHRLDELGAKPMQGSLSL